MKYACEIMQKQMKSLQNVYKIQYYMFISLQYKSSKYTTSQHHRWPASLLMSKGADILLYNMQTALFKTRTLHAPLYHIKMCTNKRINFWSTSTTKLSTVDSTISRRIAAADELLRILVQSMSWAGGNVEAATIFIPLQSSFGFNPLSGWLNRLQGIQERSEKVYQEKRKVQKGFENCWVPLFESLQHHARIKKYMFLAF